MLKPAKIVSVPLVTTLILLSIIQDFAAVELLFLLLNLVSLRSCNHDLEEFRWFLELAIEDLAQLKLTKRNMETGENIAIKILDKEKFSSTK
ncbi:hypothetical protein VNO77_34191 [Canavalia gladiata]|uniref:Uncharacterized protein n=1 Tax=Canavalia gladiata TaxID=3824 RepID=A0AAN9KD74_CANGL